MVGALVAAGAVVGGAGRWFGTGAFSLSASASCDDGSRGGDDDGIGETRRPCSSVSGLGIGRGGGSFGIGNSS